MRIPATSLAIVLAASCMIPAVHAETGKSGACSLSQSDAADNAAGSIRTWDDVAKYRRAYAVCDDGGTAESSSAAVVRLLATDWKSLPDLQAILKSEKALGPFIWRHINSTVDGAQLDQIVQHVRNDCPPGAGTLCAQIGKAVRRALAE